MQVYLNTHRSFVRSPTTLNPPLQVIDNAVTNTASAVDRMKKLLTSRDKKATILEMAEANEIDQVRSCQPNISP